MRGHKAEDLTGRRYGSLVVVSRDTTRSGVYWNCRCDCGNLTSVRVDHLRRGETKGCLNCVGKHITEGKTKHGGTRTRLYLVWRNIINRCENPNVPCYPRYGGSGVTICEEWRNSFESFRDWSIAHGYDETAPFMKCTIDRIDTYGGYSPDNCRFVDAKVQAQNRRPRRKPA